MMRMRTKSLSEEAPAKAIGATNSAPATIPVNEPAQWEVRPCGMLVQKRNGEDGADVHPLPTLRLRVKYGSMYHEIYISSQATFGELKKMLAERTGLHPQDQKILFKDKERNPAAFLDTSGVKDRSKLVVVEDPAAQAKRVLEMRRSAKMEKATKSISQICLEVDKLASQLSAIEAVIANGGKIAETEIVKLVELLMNELLKLDGIIADGDVKLQRRLQVKRVQKYVETLDVLKVKNARPRGSSGQSLVAQYEHKKQQKSQPLQSRQTPSVIVTTKWETFDSLFSPTVSPSTTATTIAVSSASPTPRFDWELF